MEMLPLPRLIRLFQTKYLLNYMEERTMARPRKDNVPVSFRLERTVFDKLNQFCEDFGQAKTVAMERALGMYIDDYYMKL